MISRVLFLAAFALLVPIASAQTPFYQESFETDGSGTRYTVVGGFSDGSSDYFVRTDGLVDAPSGLPAYSGQDVAFFVAAEDNQDGDNPNGNESYVLIEDIDVTSYSNVQIRGAFASGGQSKFDPEDYMHVYARVDDGPFQLVGAFEADIASGFNSPNLGLDADFDGIADGPGFLSTSFEDYTFDLGTTGSLLDIRVEVFMTSGDEEVAFDNIRVLGTTSGGPQTTTVGFGSSAATVGEADGTVTLPVTLTTSDGAVSEGAVTATVALTSGDAADFTGSTTADVTFPAGTPSGTSLDAAFTVADDALGEGTEAFGFTLTSTDADNLGSDAFTLTVEDDEPNVRLSLSAQSVSEGVGTFTVTAVISAAPSAPVTADLALTAGDPAQFDGYVTRTITFPPADGADQVVVVTVTDDAVQEESADFTFALQNPSSNAYVESPAEQVVTVLDDDSPFAPGDLVITEFMANPTGTSDNAGEYVEVYNNSTATINLDGLTLRDDDSDSHVIDNGGTLNVEPGQFLVLAVSASFVSGGTEVADYVYSGVFLSNGSDEIVLADGTTEIARVTYGDGDPFGAGVAAELVGLGLAADGATTEADFAAATNALASGDLGSPGAFGGTVLPVELADFAAVADGDAVVLRWSTASETNNRGFEVQTYARHAWTALDFVEGAGTSTEARAYRLRVDALGAGTHRFRLKQVDFDGTFGYSDEVEVAVEAATRFALSDAYPNPFNPLTTLTLSVQRTQPVTVTVHDLLGREVRTLFDGVVAGSETQTIRFEAGRLPSGVYFVRARGEGVSMTRRVLLLK